jgi:hypothetical protein
MPERRVRRIAQDGGEAVKLSAPGAVAILVVLILTVAPAHADHMAARPAPGVITTPAGDIVLEMVGQVANATVGSGVISMQYGYLSFIHGIADVFKRAAHARDETTALYTFFTAAATDVVPAGHADPDLDLPAAGGHRHGNPRLHVGQHQYGRCRRAVCQRRRPA